jgi:hypothetical protein
MPCSTVTADVEIIRTPPLGYRAGDEFLGFNDAISATERLNDMREYVIRDCISPASQFWKCETTLALATDPQGTLSARRATAANAGFGPSRPFRHRMETVLGAELPDGQKRQQISHFF